MRSLNEVLDGPFADWLGDGDWTPWRAFLSALRGEPLSITERRIFRKCTGRETEPTKPFNEAWVVVGRRGRKSAVASMLAVYMAVWGEWPRAAGETVRVLVVAVTRDQAKIIRSYAEAILQSHPALARRVKSTDAESITLTNGIVIQCVANSFRSIRGPTVVCAILEEIAFWYSDDSANPDREILRAIRPSMLTVPGALILGISSPYARRGLLYEKYRKHFGKDGSRVLVWKASTEIMHPAVDPEIIREAYEEDEAAARAEYGAEFRNDIESFVSREIVEACVSEGLRERPFALRTKYVAFIDPSGGSSDSMTLAIGHGEQDRAVLDVLREVKPPFSPEDVVREFAAVLKSYRISRASGDRYGGEWVVDAFKKHQITYEANAEPKSDLYRDLLPLLNSGKADLLDNDKLINQIANLERRTARSGKDSIDHAPRAHDDLANAVAGCLTSIGSKRNSYNIAGFLGANPAEEDARWRTEQRNIHIFSAGGVRPWWK